MVQVNEKTRLNNWLEQQSLDIDWLSNNTNLPISRLLSALNDPSYKPDGTTMRIILRQIKEIDADTKLSDFWDV
jgi:hypothetical protein